MVRDYVRLIGSGAVEEYAPLPTEAALCAQYGVGRSVVREALQALEAKGFVALRQGSVATVAPRHEWNLLDPDLLEYDQDADFFEPLLEAREAFEPPIAALAARRATPDDVSRLIELNRQVHITADPEEHAVRDLAFHTALAAAARNPILASQHNAIATLGARTRRRTAPVVGAIARAADWHDHIIAAVSAGDEESASAAMRLHLKQVRRDHAASLGLEASEAEEQA